MSKITLTAKEFKKMLDPVHGARERSKYVCYIQAKSIPDNISEWMQTNPREQKMTTNVATKIKESLNENEYFHELNRGIVMSVQKVEWDNKTLDLILTLNDPDIHGNIDGGHTLRAILEAKTKNTLSDDKYLFCEIFEGNDSIIELAAARNTSVQVDLKSIAELEKSFEVLKDIFKNMVFAKRIQYKMNEHYNDINIETMDVREAIAIILMFSQEIYPYTNSYGLLNDLQPVQCYSGKEASLKKFLYLNSNNSKQQKINREKMIENMAPVIKDIFDLWQTIEENFPETATKSGKRYGARKYSKYDDGEIVGQSFVYRTNLEYLIPKGIMYPLVGAFRALIQINENGTYYWKTDPKEIWNNIGGKLVSIILDEKADNPELIGKNTNLWSNLLKEVYIYGYMKR